MSKLSKKQKEFLENIPNKKERKNQKIQFKLQNKFDKFGSFEQIVFTDGIFKTDNPELIEFFQNCPMVKISENSLTKESLRDLTEPKFENGFIYKKELYKFNEEDFHKLLKTNPSLSDFYVFRDVCSNFNNEEFAKKFQDKIIELSVLGKVEKPPLGLKPKCIHDEERLIEVKEAIQRYIDKCKLIPSEWIEEKYQLEKSIISRKSANQNIPKEFCVEITEENKVVELSLEKIDSAKTDDAKTLEFDLTKKEDFNVKDYLCFDLEELFFRVNSGEITIINLYNILQEQKINSSSKQQNSIQDYIFKENGNRFKYKEVLGLQPESNINGLIWINSRFYEKALF